MRTWRILVCPIADCSFVEREINPYRTSLGHPCMLHEEEQMVPITVSEAPTLAPPTARPEVCSTCGGRGEVPYADRDGWFPCQECPKQMDEPFTAKEIQTLFAAMAGNFPESLAPYRMSAMRKLAKLNSSALPEATDV